MKFSQILFLGSLIGAQSASMSEVHAKDLYVSQRTPQASDMNPGTAQRPFLTIGRAVREMSPGDRILIEEGVYREALDFRKSRLSTTDPTARPSSVQAVKNASVTISAAEVVENWEALGDGLYVRRGWNTPSQVVAFDGRLMMQVGGEVFGGVPGNTRNPLSNLHSKQGGIWPGRRAGAREDLPEGAFFYDSASGNLYVRVQKDVVLTAHRIEASVRPFLVIGERLMNLSISGLNFEYSNYTYAGRNGAIALYGQRIAVSNIAVRYSDGICLNITGDDNVVENSRFEHCGQLGMAARGRRVRIEGNVFAHNNWRGFNKSWEAGGAKFVGDGGLQDSQVIGNTFAFNVGDGLWFDWGNRNLSVINNVAAFNTGIGIHYEASFDALIAHNTSYGNGQRGIYLPQSSGSVVTRNLVIANGSQGIVVIDEQRRDAKLDLEPKSNSVVQNIIGWNQGGELYLPSPVGSNRSASNVYIVDGRPVILASGWPSSARPPSRSLAAWRAAAKMDLDSVVLSDPLPKSIHDELTGRRLMSLRPLIIEGVPALPGFSQGAEYGRFVLPPGVAVARFGAIQESRNAARK